MEMNPLANAKGKNEITLQTPSSPLSSDYPGFEPNSIEKLECNLNDIEARDSSFAFNHIVMYRDKKKLSIVDSVTESICERNQSMDSEAARESAKGTNFPVESKTKKARMIFLFALLLPFFCAFQFVKSVRDQIFLILWRYVLLHNDAIKLRFPIDTRQEMETKAKGLGFYRSMNLFQILLRVSTRYYVLVFNFISLLVSVFDHRDFLSVDKFHGQDGINSFLFTFIQFLVYTIVAYVNLLSWRKVRGDIHDYVSQFYSIPFQRILDSDHTELKSVTEIKDDLLKYGYVFLTLENQGYIILSLRNFEDLDINGLICEKAFRSDQEITFLKIRHPYHPRILQKRKLLVSVFREKGYRNVLKRDISSDITLSDLRIYNMISLLVQILYYLTSLDLHGHFYVLFTGLLIYFMALFIYRIRRYTNIQFRVLSLEMIPPPDNHQDSTYHVILPNNSNKMTYRMNSNSNLNNVNNTNPDKIVLTDLPFLGIYYLEKKGKDREFNPWVKIRARHFYTVFVGTELECCVSDILLKLCHCLSYEPWEKGLKFRDFVVYLDRISNLNRIGLRLVTRDYQLYCNIEEKMFPKVIMFDSGFLSLEDPTVLQHYKIQRQATKEEFDAFESQYVM